MDIAARAKPSSGKVKRQRRKAPQARGELRRRHLIDAAVELLCTRHIQDVTYADIADFAGVPLPSCYHFYRNKLELMTAVSESQAPIYRREVYEADLDPRKIRCWSDIIDVTTDRSRRFLNKNPWAREIWLSGHVPPAISLETRERERGLAAILITIFDRFFYLPDIPNREQVFYNAFELGDRIYSVSQTQNGFITDFMAEEAKKAKKGYLLFHLPADMKRKDERSSGDRSRK